MASYSANRPSPAHNYFSCMKRALVPTLIAANDNNSFSNDQLLHAALLHFASHGLHAAKEAKREAERSFFCGDRERYDWWLGVCRTLDRRMADQITAEQERQA